METIAPVDADTTMEKYWYYSSIPDQAIAFTSLCTYNLCQNSTVKTGLQFAVYLVTNLYDKLVFMIYVCICFFSTF